MKANKVCYECLALKLLLDLTRIASIFMIPRAYEGVVIETLVGSQRIWRMVVVNVVVDEGVADMHVAGGGKRQCKAV
jgi:hypothetical protein